MHDPENPPKNGQPHRRKALRVVIGTIGAASLGGLAYLLGTRENDPMDNEHREQDDSIRGSILERLEPRNIEWILASDLLRQRRIDCIDGRSPHRSACSPGGDMGALFLHLTALEQLSQREIPPAEVLPILSQYMRSRGPFYMHSDGHALHHLAHTINMDEGILRTMLNAPGIHSERLRTALADSTNMGCGHLKQIAINSQKYPGARPELLRGLIGAFFDLKWRGERMEYVVLEGEHEEEAILQVVGKQPITEQSMVPLIQPRTKNSSVFVLHPDIERLGDQQFAEWIRAYAKDRGAPEFLRAVRMDAPVFAETSARLREGYLEATRQALAPKKPLYTAEFSTPDTPIILR